MCCSSAVIACTTVAKQNSRQLGGALCKTRAVQLGSNEECVQLVLCCRSAVGAERCTRRTRTGAAWCLGAVGPQRGFGEAPASALALSSLWPCSALGFARRQGASRTTDGSKEEPPLPHILAKQHCQLPSKQLTVCALADIIRA